MPDTNKKIKSIVNSSLCQLSTLHPQLYKILFGRNQIFCGLYQKWGPGEPS